MTGDWAWHRASDGYLGYPGWNLPQRVRRGPVAASTQKFPYTEKTLAKQVAVAGATATCLVISTEPRR